jgi:hypothetical protein
MTTSFSIYNSIDNMPLSKLKEKYIATFFDKQEYLLTEIKKNQSNTNSKLFIEETKAFLINNEFCFVYIYQNPIERNQLLEMYVRKQAGEGNDKHRTNLNK